MLESDAHSAVDLAQHPRSRRSHLLGSQQRPYELLESAAHSSADLAQRCCHHQSHKGPRSRASHHHQGSQQRPGGRHISRLFESATSAARLQPDLLQRHSSIKNAATGVHESTFASSWGSLCTHPQRFHGFVLVCLQRHLPLIRLTSTIRDMMKTPASDQSMAELRRCVA